MTVVDLLESFLPDNDAPLLVSLSNLLREHGYATKIEFDFWDMKAYRDKDQAEIAITTVNNHVNSTIFQKIVDSEAAYKIVLVEGDRISLAKLENQARFLAMLGVGVYVRGVGWAILPGMVRLDGVEDFMFRMLPKYTQDEDGTWGKFCTKCGAWYPHTEFYANPNRTHRDPYRNQCKTCFNGG